MSPGPLFFDNKAHSRQFMKQQRLQRYNEAAESGGKNAPALIFETSFSVPLNKFYVPSIFHKIKTHPTPASKINSNSTAASISIKILIIISIDIIKMIDTVIITRATIVITLTLASVSTILYTQSPPLSSLLLPRLAKWVECFANAPGDLGSIPGHVIPRTLKMVYDISSGIQGAYKG